MFQSMSQYFAKARQKVSEWDTKDDPLEYCPICAKRISIPVPLKTAWEAPKYCNIRNIQPPERLSNLSKSDPLSSCLKCLI